MPRDYQGLQLFYGWCWHSWSVLGLLCSRVQGLKWWRRVFYYLLEMAIVNAYAIYKVNSPEAPLTHKQFRLELAKSLCEPLLLARARPCSSYLPVRGRRPTQGHARLKENTFCIALKNVVAAMIALSKSNQMVNLKIQKSVHNAESVMFTFVGKCFEAYHTKAYFWILLKMKALKCKSSAQFDWNVVTFGLKTNLHVLGEHNGIYENWVVSNQHQKSGPCSSIFCIDN